MADRFILSRDVPATIEEKGFEKGTIYLIQALSEKIKFMQQTMNQQQELIDRMTNIVSNMVDVGHKLNTEVTRLRGKFDREKDHDEPMQGK